MESHQSLREERPLAGDWLKDIWGSDALGFKSLLSCANTESFAPLFQISNIALLYTSSPGQ